MATKVTSKVPAKADKANAKEKEIQTVQVPSQVATLIGTAANADKARQVAATTSEQTLVKLGTALFTTMGKHPRDVVRASIAPLFTRAYTDANKGLAKPKEEAALKLYIGQQLSRTLSIAFPGGAKADAKQTETARKNVERGVKEGRPVQEIYSLASGNFAFDKKGAIVRVREETRGASNKDKPIDAFRKALSAAMSTGKTAKLSIEQMLNAFSDTAVELELIQDGSELADLLAD